MPTLLSSQNAQPAITKRQVYKMAKYFVANPALCLLSWPDSYGQLGSALAFLVDIEREASMFA
jgi:hypothetical protein